MSGTVILLKLIGETLAFGVVTVAITLAIVAACRGSRK